MSETGTLSSKKCTKEYCKNNTPITLELIDIPEWDLGPEDLKQTDLLSETPPSGGYENIIRAINVILRYAFAYPISKPTAVNTAKVILDIMTGYACLPTLIKTDKGIVFVAQVMHEKSETIGVSLGHATRRQAQTVGFPEWAHATSKTSFKSESGDYSK